VPYVLYVV